MHVQHIIETEPAQREGIFVPLDLPGFQICQQYWQEDGTICVTIMAQTAQACCPRCFHLCTKIHDRRVRKKRDLPCQAHQVQLMLLKRRFRCEACQAVFTEPAVYSGRHRARLPNRARNWSRRSTRRGATSWPTAVSCSSSEETVRCC